MNTEYHYLVNIYKNDCSVCEENALVLREAAELDTRISVHDVDFNLDKPEFKSWLEENSITDAPAVVAVKDEKMLGKLSGSVTVQEILDLFPEEDNS
jgi:hypothetical protein